MKKGKKLNERQRKRCSGVKYAREMIVLFLFFRFWKWCFKRIEIQVTCVSCRWKRLKETNNLMIKAKKKKEKRWWRISADSFVLVLIYYFFYDENLICQKKTLGMFCLFTRSPLSLPFAGFTRKKTTKLWQWKRQRACRHVTHAQSFTNVKIVLPKRKFFIQTFELESFQILPNLFELGS